MYRKIYQILEETGKVKTAMVLNGNHKGEKCLIKENHCLSSDENTADFWKKYEADLAECQETKVVHMGDVDFFVEIYVKNPQLIIFWRRTCFAACCKNRKNAGISSDCYG